MIMISRSCLFRMITMNIVMMIIMNIMLMILINIRMMIVTCRVRLSRSCLSTGTIKATSAPVQWESCNDDRHNFEEGDHGVGGDVDVEDVKDDIYGEDNSVVKVKL